MASSSVEICNSALIKIGALPINALSDDTKAARLCNRRYDDLRKTVLRAHSWNFAIRRKSLAKNVTDPEWGYDSAFTLGSDVLRVLETNLTEFSDWAIEQNASNTLILVCNSTSVKIRYIKDVTDTTIFSSNFEDALSFRIAADLAYPLVQSRALMRDMYEAYERYIAQARSFDAQERSEETLKSDSWILERF